MRNELERRAVGVYRLRIFKETRHFNISEIQNFIHYFIQNGNMGKNTGKNYGGFVWAYFIFQQWYQVYGR